MFLQMQYLRLLTKEPGILLNYKALPALKRFYQLRLYTSVRELAET